MGYIVKTMLGRYVDADNWRERQSDTIRRVLFEASNSPFNPKNDPVALVSLCNASGLSPADVRALCEDLRLRNEVEIIAGDRYRLSGTGRVVVQDILARDPYRGVI